MKNKKNKIFNNLEEEINISVNSSEKELDEIFNNEDNLTYSESKSHSTITNNYLVKSKNDSLKNIVIYHKTTEKEEKKIITNNNESKISSLQISLSNLLSDVESKETIFNKKNDNNNILNKDNNNGLINISNEICSNENESDINNNINFKLRKNQNDEQSSLCNYSKSIYTNNINNQNENKVDNIKKNLFTSPNKRKEYQIEKGENINISLQKKDNNNKTKRIFNITETIDNNHIFYNNSLSINKTHNFIINNTIEYNTNYNLTQNNFSSKDNNTKFANIKNKVKLINNKNIDLNKADSKKFFYNPKKSNDNTSKKILNRNLENPKFKTIEYQNEKYNKTKIEITEINLGTNNTDNYNHIKYKEKNFKTDFKKKNDFYKRIIKIKNNMNDRGSGNNSLIKKKKLFYINKTKTSKNISINNNNITEPSITKKIKLKNIISKDLLMNKIKTEQKKTTHKLINKLNNINNNTNNSIINFLPIFNKTFHKKLKTNKNSEKNIENKNTENINKIKIDDKNNKDNNNNIIDNNTHKKIKSQINFVSLLNNFNKEKNKGKKQKSIFNFGNIFFINQNQNQIHKKMDTDIEIKNDITIKQKPQIITDFSNYIKIRKNKNNNKKMINHKSKRLSTEINLDKIKNKFKTELKLKI